MRQKKSRFTILVLAILTLSSIWTLPLAHAVVPPEVPGGGEYYSDYGVLDTDTYFLYPWEDTSIQVGFSKYGELINEDQVNSSTRTKVWDSDMTE